ncbi:MAG: hypothetical protein DYG83_16500 [Candidatus Brocadia sp. AMX2]|uniref:hypothetical protein n=1 Tax=Candidatus Brocadia TaxID=380240 RepID=UPI000699077A|nr:MULTISPECIES: hypothetical protein [Brocadia]MBC6933489.1 hypothetical protein [Candidatus Brocadia sp.]MBL1170286.1 hypothetical protein [Candidatus Brocadia sp. AMX1]MCK6469533.1 hypothetical protein [Candidatus Brocadia sinica]NOG42499.1 hypothetical protein [Planctomycetota bacterium]KAA0242351.1 MAG: hypothetical protein EDM70_14635 [Candidatus Brocadia sp. AMX2]
MNDKSDICKEFITDGTSRQMCNAYAKILLPLYPSPNKIRMFCETANHKRCPIRNFSALINSSGIKTAESDVQPYSKDQKEKSNPTHL